MIETPIGDLQVASDIRQELLSTGHFGIMERQVDEEEHSGEMQYPYIAKMLSSAEIPTSSVTVLPIMVGGISTDKEIFFGELLSGILARDSIFTVVSSDFCHWGRRFGYFPPHDRDYKALALKNGEKKQGQGPDLKKAISEYIKDLDHMGMVSNFTMKRSKCIAEGNSI